jgi:ribosomal protein S18 acetylase RimI-like enzyme
MTTLASPQSRSHEDRVESGRMHSGPVIPSPVARLRWLGKIFSQEGWRGLLGRVGRKIYQAADFGYLELSLSEVVPHFSLRGKAIIERVDSLTKDLAAADEGLGEEIASHLRRGLVVFVAREAGRIVGVVSFSRSNFHEEKVNLRVCVRPHQVYCAAFRVHTAYHRTHVAGALSETAILYYRDLGLRTMTALVRLENRPAVRMLRNLGFREVRRFRGRRVVGRLLPAGEVSMTTNAGLPQRPPTD